MTRFFIVLAILFSFISSANIVSASDFFTNNIVGYTAIEDRFDDIRLKSFIFRSDVLNTKLMDARLFVSKAKRDTLVRLQDGSVSKYTAEDIASNLEYLTYSLNNYFANMKSFERTGRKDFRTIANQNLKDADMIYTQLKAITWNASRQ
ncbi:MAG: hypothetical protein ACOYN2_00315 [Patescibacteria group bacterium]